MSERRPNAPECQEIIKTLPDMIYVLDAEFHFTFVNDAMVSVTGYDRETLLGAHASIIFDEEDIEKGRWNRDRLEASACSFGRLETELRTADDDSIPCEIRGRLLPDHDDGPGGGTAGVIRDITERKRRQQQLRGRSDAMEAAIDGMALLDDDEEYVFVNHAHAEIYGYDEPDAFLGESWRMCYEEDAVLRFEETVLPTLYEQGEWRGEAVGLRKDGSTFPQELSLSVTAHNQVICIVRDITERKQRERELQRKNERLEEFASVVSHDIRNPLSVVEGRIKLAREDSDSEHLDAAAQAVDRMGTLIDDLLALAREGDQISELEPVDLDATIQDCWRTVKTENATLVTETDQTIHADRSRLKQLLENLMRNAIEHGNGDVTITVGNLTEKDGFYIADDGPGLPEGEPEKVFDAGYSTTKAGTGFGLNIVQEITKAHGWTVQITESEGGGARFEITDVRTGTAP
jgi:PAS domain S-box-containing protein